MTLTGTAGFLAEHFTKQLDSHEGLLRDLTAGGHRAVQVEPVPVVTTAPPGRP